MADPYPPTSPHAPYPPQPSGTAQRLNTGLVDMHSTDSDLPAVEPPPAKLDDHKGHNRRLFLVTFIARNEEGAAVTEVIERDQQFIRGGCVVFSNGAEYEAPSHTLLLNLALIERVEEITDRPDKESEHGR